MNSTVVENAETNPLTEPVAGMSKRQAVELMKCVKGDGPKLCGAKTRSGTTCKKPPLEGRTRCKLHGGATPRGTDSPHYKHGLYAKALPKQLKTTFDKLVNDPNLLDGKAEVALMQMRLTSLAARVETNENGRSWARLQELFAEFKAANEAEDQPRQLAALNAMDVIVNGQVSAERAWEELTEFVDKATRISEREWKRVLANRQVVSVEQVHAIASALIAAVNLNVKDTQTRLAIAEHFRRLNVVSVQSLQQPGIDAADPLNVDG